eukprot:scaffold2788_cov32-Tisochrysis_lutea.AAC.1
MRCGSSDLSRLPTGGSEPSSAPFVSISLATGRQRSARRPGCLGRGWLVWSRARPHGIRSSSAQRRGSGGAMACRELGGSGWGQWRRE